MNDGAKTSKAFAWLQLLRLPNLFTVPGDPLAGFVLAAGGVEAALGARPSTAAMAVPAGLAMLASLLLYCAGLIHNDLCDLDVDRAERPRRPLPSGRISTRAASYVAAVFVAGGVAASAEAGGITSAIVAVVLALCILLYNQSLKRIAVVGPLAMGLCRGLSLLLGASAVGVSALAAPTVLVAGATLTLYIAAVTAIAAGETTGRPVGFKRWLPAAVLLVGLGALAGELHQEFAAHKYFNSAPWPAAALLLSWWLLPVAGAIAVAVRLRSGVAPALVQRGIGQFIRNLFLVQWAMVSLAFAWPPHPALTLQQYLLTSGGLVLAWLLAAILGRRFYAS